MSCALQLFASESLAIVPPLHLECQVSNADPDRAKPARGLAQTHLLLSASILFPRRLAAPYRKALADCMQCRFIAIRQYRQQRGLALSYCRLIGTDLSCNFLISRPSDFLSDVFGREDIQVVRYIEMLRVV
jgi:hypothetical protein